MSDELLPKPEDMPTMRPLGTVTPAHEKWAQEMADKMLGLHEGWGDWGDDEALVVRTLAHALASAEQMAAERCCKAAGGKPYPDYRDGSEGPDHDPAGETTEAAQAIALEYSLFHMMTEATKDKALAARR